MSKAKPICLHTEKDRDWKHLLLPAFMKLADIRKLGPEDLPAPLPPIIVRPAEFCLKKLMVYQKLSQETTAFTADVWFRKKLIGHASNDGGGGCLNLQPVARDSLKEAEEWAATLPPESSYQRVYEDMVTADGEHAVTTLEGLHAEYWCTTTIMNLPALIEAFVSREATRKETKRIKDHVILGPPKSSPTMFARLIYFNAKATPIQRARTYDNHQWACPLSDVFNLPFHYYPSPHPFGGLGYPEVKVRAGDRTGVVTYAGTNDHQVAVRFDDNTAETVIADPGQLQLQE